MHQCKWTGTLRFFLFFSESPAQAVVVFNCNSSLCRTNVNGPEHCDFFCFFPNLQRKPLWFLIILLKFLVVYGCHSCKVRQTVNPYQGGNYSRTFCNSSLCRCTNVNGPEHCDFFCFFPNLQRKPLWFLIVILLCADAPM